MDAALYAILKRYIDETSQTVEIELEQYYSIENLIPLSNQEILKICEKEGNK